MTLPILLMFLAIGVAAALATAGVVTVMSVVLIGRSKRQQ